MAREVKMPKMSGTTEEVVLLRWKVKVGDTVKRGDALCEVETDKTTLDVETFEAGTVLELRAAESETVTAGAVIAILGEAGEKAQASPRAPAAGPALAQPPAGVGRGAVSPAPAPAPAPAQAGRHYTRSPDGVVATPLVRNIAARRGVDLTTIQGTGPRGLITRADLDTASAPAAAKTHSPGPARGAAEALGSLSPEQEIVGRNLSRWWSVTPHFYLKMTVGARSLLARRALLKHPDGNAVSLNALVLHALARTLALYPRLRSGYRDGKITVGRPVNLGLAVAVGDELTVPVIRDADRKGELEIDREITWLVAKARSGKLEPSDVADGVFTLTNLGMYGIDEFSAIIAPGQPGILALGRIRKELEVRDDGAMSVEAVTVLTAAFDHRVVNGAQAAQFLQALKKQIEERATHA